MNAVAVILALFKLIPLLEKWFDRIQDAKIAAMKKENREAIKTAIENHDQRPVEIAIGSTEPGVPSGIPGAVIVDKLPGVK